MILYEDADLLLAEKPVGVLSQEDAAGGDSLPRRLAAAGYPVKPVHRLDRTTGGVMVFARSARGAAALSALVGQHEEFEKTYLAVAEGVPVPAAGEMHDLLYHDLRKNKSFVVRRERKGVRAAALTYETVATAETPDGTLSLVRIRLHTGRTHQIRVQFASRGWPLWGDRRYGAKNAAGNAAPALWSHRLTFPHPFTGETVTAESRPDENAVPWVWFD